MGIPTLKMRPIVWLSSTLGRFLSPKCHLPKLNLVTLAIRLHIGQFYGAQSTDGSVTKCIKVSNQETLEQSQFLTFNFPKCLPDHCRALTLANVTFSDAKCCVEKKSKWLSGRSQLSSCTSKAQSRLICIRPTSGEELWGKFTSVLSVALPAGEPNSEPFPETIHVSYLCGLPPRIRCLIHYFPSFWHLCLPHRPLVFHL